MRGVKGRASGDRSGQAILETCLMLFVVCLIFAAVFQVSRILAAKEVLWYGAACSARAKTVGFNRWMVRKVGMVAVIPNAGKLTEPTVDWEDEDLLENVRSRGAFDFWSWVLSRVPVSDQYQVERARIPDFLYAVDEYVARNVLDYADWDTVEIRVPNWAGGGGGQAQMVETKVSQDYPLTVPLHRAFYASDAVDLEGEYRMENHYELYLEDESR